MAEDLASSGYITESNTVLCPICFKKFTLQQIEALSVEHILPHALGGKQVTLTCRINCNSVSGSEIDVHLINKIRVEQALDRNEPIKANFRMSNINAGGPVNFYFKPSEGISFTTTDKFGAIPAARLHEHFSNPANRYGPLKIRLNFSEEKVFAAIAKAAYLGAFKVCGYRYVLHPWLDPIRDAIRHQGPNRARLEEIIHRLEVRNLTGAPAMPPITLLDRQIGGTPVTVSVISLPGNVATYLAVLPSRRDFTTGAWDGLARTASRMRAEGILDFKAEQIQPAN